MFYLLVSTGLLFPYLFSMAMLTVEATPALARRHPISLSFLVDLLPRLGSLLAISLPLLVDLLPHHGSLLMMDV